MKTRILYGFMGVLVCLAVAGGCIRGPLRSVVVSDGKSATVQWAKGNPVLSPLLIPAGVLT